ncbi:hypothetical protein PL329_01460 [Escherichia coli]|nr:hypothetical protein [Escherichia coli]WCE54139.1 hypothetical protein PL329_01460 [Escherichia coli]
MFFLYMGSIGELEWWGFCVGGVRGAECSGGGFKTGGKNGPGGVFEILAAAVPGLQEHIFFPRRVFVGGKPLMVEEFLREIVPFFAAWGGVFEYIEQEWGFFWGCF